MKNLDEAFKRTEEHVVPLEDDRMKKTYSMNTSLNKKLIINKEQPSRIKIILVRERLGF